MKTISCDEFLDIITQELERAPYKGYGIRLIWQDLRVEVHRHRASLENAMTAWNMLLVGAGRHPTIEELHEDLQIDLYRIS